MKSHLQLAPAPEALEPPLAAERPIRVVMADDHDSMRRNLRRLLESEHDVEVVAEATDLDTAARQVHEHAPHVLILDLHMPNGSSVATIRELRRLVPDTEIVVLTMEASPAVARHVLDAGAVGYVLKEHSDPDLPLAVRAAARGRTYVTPQVAAGLRGMWQAASEDRLTSRESEVLRLTALGYTGTEVARRLHISRRTVDSHRASVHHKLGVETRADLVGYALRHGLLGG
jgi:DNA-binding NarL/FixJ family response regulator